MSLEPKSPYSCRKCGHAAYETGEIRASGGVWSSLFDLETERFSFVACAKCQYTEFYRTELSNLQKVLDLLAG